MATSNNKMLAALARIQQQDSVAAGIPKPAPIPVYEPPEFSVQEIYKIFPGTTAVGSRAWQVFLARMLANLPAYRSFFRHRDSTFLLGLLGFYRPLVLEKQTAKSLDYTFCVRCGKFERSREMLCFQPVCSKCWPARGEDSAVTEEVRDVMKLQELFLQIPAIEYHCIILEFEKVIG